jgi:pSer/pThr/pTyr-binding forkhead associated (FHA) protein
MVPRPETAVAPTSSPRAAAGHVATVMTPQGSVELTLGSHVVGRLARCEVPIDDPLTSRVHAVIRIDEHYASIEDLHSSNGVYVNDLRVVRAAVLKHGDRILVGTTELSFFRPEGGAGSEARLSAAAPKPAKISLGRIVASEGAPTEKAAVLDLVGAFAKRLATEGNVVEAERVLSAQLLRVVEGAQSGLGVTEEVCDLASGHALALAGWTRKSRWTDYVIELHLAARRVMSRQTFESFANVRERLAGRGDELLVGYYVDSIKERPEGLSDAERVVLFELEALARG